MGKFTRTVAVMLACTAAVSMAACKSNKTTGAPPTAPAVAQWDPCTIPNQAISAAGLKVESKHPIDLTSLKACHWDGSWFDLSVRATFNSYESVKADTIHYAEREPVVVGTRHATLLRGTDMNDKAVAECAIAFDVPPQAVVLTVSNNPLVGHPGDYCAEVIRVANALESALPAGK